MGLHEKMKKQSLHQSTSLGSTIRNALEDAGYRFAPKYEGWAREGGITFQELTESKAYAQLRGTSALTMLLTRGSRVRVEVRVGKDSFILKSFKGEEKVDRMDRALVGRMRALADEQVEKSLANVIRFTG